VIRRAAGPLVLGVAAWCAAGTLTVASSSSAMSRFAAPAPWWIFAAATAIAFLLPPVGRSPLASLPALLSVLPWLPVPLLPVALIWTGPLAWAPILAALGLAFGLTPLRWVAARVNLFEADDAVVAAMVAAAALCGLAAWSAHSSAKGGDEPHYLVIAQSLLKDGDIEIGNNHRNRDYAQFYDDDLEPHMQMPGKHGEIYSVHAPGVPVLVAPVFQLFGYVGVRVFLVLLAAVGAGLIWRLAWRLTDSPDAAWFAWAAVVCSPTFLLQSFMVFPDGPALLLTATAALFLVQLARRDVPGWLPCVLTGAALAALPWLHTRLAVLAAGFGIVITLRLLAIKGAGASTLSRVAAFLAVPIISALCWFWFFKALYGTFDPRAPYGPEPHQVAWIVPAILGLFFDGQFGLAAYAPAIAAAFAGWWRRTEWFSRRLALELAVIVFAYLAAITTVRMWWAGGPAIPARFMMAVLPILAAPLAVAWIKAGQSLRAALGALAAIGAMVSLVLIGQDQAALAWNVRNAEPQWLEWLSPVANLSRAWPGFFWDEPRFPFHVIAWLAIGFGLWVAVSRLIRPARSAAAVWLAATLMIAAPFGWAFTWAAPLDPATSQRRLLSEAGQGRQLVAIGPGRWARVSTPDGIVVRAEESGASDEPPALFAFSEMPAGEYQIRVANASAAPVPVRVFVGRIDRPWREFVAAPGTSSFRISLPAVMPRFLVDTDAAWRTSLTIELAATRVPVSAEPLVMRSAARYRDTDVLFLDDGAYAEESGFWLRGKSSTRFLLTREAAGAPGPATIRILVRNGGAQNSVAVESGTYQRMLMMTPAQAVEIDLPVDAAGAALVRVASGSGFTPSAADRRYLGVWVEVR
jgi:hypothetical protein